MKIAITLPSQLLQTVERKRKVVEKSRSEFFRLALESFLGFSNDVDKGVVKKYKAAYEAVEQEDRQINHEMLSIARKTIA
jgi:metal-responsive CopG/Arc/MetJ family transcriptional regulator